MSYTLGENLLRFKKDQKYICLDFETENLNLLPVHNKPWQASFVIGEGNSILEKHDYYIYWKDLNISDDAKRITHFSQDVYNKNAKPLNEVLPIIDKYLYDPDYILLWFNGLNFDSYMHNILRKRAGLKTDYSYIYKSIDVNCLAKAIKLQIDFNNQDNFIAWQYALSDVVQRGLKTNLALLCKEYNIPLIDNGGFHNALNDVIYTFQVYHKLIWELTI